MANYYTQLVVQPEIPAQLLDEALRDRLEQCGLNCDHDQREDTYYIYSMEHASDDDAGIAFEEVLQEVVTNASGKLPRLTIEAALVCSKPRPDGFGGFAMVITASNIKYMSTSLWIQANL